MSEFLGLNMPEDVAIALAARKAITGETKTKIALNALRKYLGLKVSELSDRVEDLDTRVSEIEARLDV